MLVAHTRHVSGYRCRCSLRTTSVACLLTHNPCNVLQDPLPTPLHPPTWLVRLCVSCSSCSMVAANAGLVGATLLLLSISSSSLSSAFSSRKRSIAALWVHVLVYVLLMVGIPHRAPASPSYRCLSTTSWLMLVDGRFFMVAMLQVCFLHIGSAHHIAQDCVDHNSE